MKPERARKIGLVGVGNTPQVLRGPHHQQIDVPQAAMLLGRQPRQHLVDLTQMERVGVEQIEEDRVEQHAGHLCRRRIAGDDRAVGLRLRAGMSRGHGEDPLRAEMDGGRQRRGQPDPAVPVPGARDLDGRKKKGSAADAMTCSTRIEQVSLLRSGRSHSHRSRASRVCTQVIDWPVV